MDQWNGLGVSGYLPILKGGPSRLDDGKASGVSVPNTVNINRQTARKDFIRGYVMNATGGQTEYPMFLTGVRGYGSEWKREMKNLYPAQARVWCAGGEMLARKENRVELDPEVKDAWGIPVLRITCTYSDNERRMYDHFYATALEWFKAAHGEVLAPNAPPVAGGETVWDRKRGIGIPGATIHEVGTSRMSSDPKQGVLNSFCQSHDIPNLYVFGGGAFPSTGDKHPTLTMMALTARGCDHLLAQSKGTA
jgi:choline dehydrogenase-like flavoprotein